MRTLHESLLDINDAEAGLETIIMIDKWCKDNVGGNYVIDKKTLTINSEVSIVITNTKLTGFPSYIRFGTVGGDFDCSHCTSLKSLEGAPEKVKLGFFCSDCTSLKSLKGVPKEVDTDFSCNGCTSLNSLEGAPKKVGRNFYCRYCTSLTSL